MHWVSWTVVQVSGCRRCKFLVSVRCLAALAGSFKGWRSSVYLRPTRHVCVSCKGRLLHIPFPLHYSSRITPFASCFRRPSCFLTSVFSGFCWCACATQVTRCAKEYTAHDTLPQQYIRRYITLTIELFSSFCAPHVQVPVITLASRESMS